MKSTAIDTCILFHVRGNSLNGFIGLVTDDSINNKSAEYQCDERDTSMKFVTLTKRSFPMRILGYLINHETNSRTIGPKKYIPQLQLTNTNTFNYDFFRTVCGQLLFNAQFSHSDMSYSVAQSSQTPNKQISLQDCQSINSTVTYLEAIP